MADAKGQIGDFIMEFAGWSKYFEQKDSNVDMASFGTGAAPSTPSMPKDPSKSQGFSPFC
jgi:hypothetical protein